MVQIGPHIKDSQVAFELLICTVWNYRSIEQPINSLFFPFPPIKIDSVVSMEPGKTCASSAFDTLFKRNVPHIIENIFFSLDYKSFKTCMKPPVHWKSTSISISILPDYSWKFLEIPGSRGKTNMELDLLPQFIVQIPFPFTFKPQTTKSFQKEKKKSRYPPSHFELIILH